MTSLTKELLLALKPEAKKVEVEGLGVVYIKPLTELLRSRRMTEAYGKDGKLCQDYKQKMRAKMIVDQLCDEKGEPLFTDADLNDVLNLEGAKLDKLCDAIHDFNEKPEKKDPGE